MRMEREVLPPCVKYTGEPHLTVSFSSAVLNSPGSGLKHDRVKSFLILIDHGIEFTRNSKDNMIVRDIKETLFIFIDPFLTLKRLAHRTVSVSARIIVNDFITTGITVKLVEAHSFAVAVSDMIEDTDLMIR